MRTRRYLLVVLAASFLGLVLRATTPLHVETGTWMSAGQMSSARVGAATVLLPDGRMMIIGGADASGNPLNTAEFFNTDGTFSPAPSMSSPRTGHAAIWLLTGEVLVTGGTTTGGGATNSVETFDPLTNTWTTLPVTLGDARSGHALAQLADGSVLVVGGENSGTPVTSLETYSLLTSNFTFSGAMTTARTDAAAAALPDGRVLIAGGSSAGSDGNAVPLATTLIYDPATGTLSDGPAMSSPRVRATATTTYDGVAIIGGNDGANDLGTADIYSQWKNTFRAVAGATPRSGHVALLLPNNGGILVTGGTGGASVDVLQPWRNNKAGLFLNANPSLSNHDGGFLSPIGVAGLMLAAGGKGDVASNAELYAFPTIATDKSDYAPGTTVFMTGAGFQPGETITIHLDEWVSNTPTTYPDYTVTADAYGAFTFSEYAPTPADLNSRYHLTAIGQSSGLQAQTVFTDGNATSVAGIVKDNLGNLIGGATVSCSAGCNATATTTTDVNGAYIFDGKTGHGPKLSFSQNPPPDVILTLTASKSGYTSGSVTVTITAANQQSDISARDIILTPSTTSVVASITAANKTYDGNNTAAITSCTLSGVAAGDVGNVTCSAASATFSNQNVGTNKTVTASGLTLSGSAAGKYTLSSTTATTTANITAATLTYTANPVSRAYNTDNPTFTGTVTGFVGTDTQANATAGTATFTTTATKTSAPGSYPINGGGLTANNGNYTLAQAAGNATALTITKAGQTITFAQPTTPATYNTSFTVNPTSDSGLTVSLAAETGSVCTVTAQSGGYSVHMDSGTGNCVLTASQAGNDNYSAATSVSRTVAAQKADQTITFGALTNKTFGDADFTVSATASSNLAVSFAATGNCSVSSNNVHITGAGSCTITASQPGNSNYNAATDLPQSFTIDKATQSITVTTASPAYAIYNTSFTVAATASSGLPVSYASSGVCSNSGATFTMSSGIGTCTVKYDQAGNDNYKPATEVTASVTAQKADQTITFGALSGKTYGDADFNVSATASSSLAVSFGATGACSVSGSTVHLTGAGNCTVTASQAGNDNYNAAKDVQQSFTIDKAATTTAVTCGVGPFAYNGSAQTPCSATVTGPGLSQAVEVTYSNNINAGTATASATYAESANYKASSDSKTFTIDKAGSTTTVTCPAGPFTYNGAAQTPCSASATGAGGLNQTLTVTYSNNTNAGTANASAAFDGDANHKPSSDSKEFTIEQAPSVTVVTCDAGPFMFNGTAQTPCSGAVTGAGGLSQPVAVTYENNLNAGTATANAVYAGDSNHKSSSDSKQFTIEQAASTTLVSCDAGPFTYSGAAYTPCTATVTGVGGLSEPLTVNYSDNVNAGSATANASFAGDLNHKSSSDSKTFAIDKAGSTTVVTCGTGPFTYNGAAQTPCTATVTGVGGLNQELAVTYENNVNAGTATANASFPGDTNHNGSHNAEHFTIGKASSTVTVNCPTAPVIYTGAAIEACTAEATGVGMAAVNLAALTYADNVNVGTATASATWDGDSNHTGNANSASFTIAKASSTVTVTCNDVIYNGAAQTPCTAEATGAGGLKQSLSVTYANNTNHGTATANASYAGDSNHDGNSGTKTFTIARAPVTATAGSGSGTYNGSMQAPSACALSGAYMGDLTCTNNPLSVGPDAGTYSISPVVNGTGLGNFEITPISGSYVINRADQVITFTGAPGSAVYGTTFTVTAIASSGLPVTIGVSGSCTINQPSSPAVVTITAASGTCLMTADQGGNKNYNAAPPATQQTTAKPWTLSGFYQPVNMLAKNTVKGGSTVPLKFNVYQGSTERKDVAAVKSFQYGTVACGALDVLPSDPVDVITTGGTTLRYDTTGGQFIQNWQTPKQQGCFAVIMTAQDGSTITAYFQTK